MAQSKLVAMKENITRGDTPVISFPFTVGGLPVDLTGWKLTFTAQPISNPGNSAVPTIQISTTGDVTGIVNFQLLQGQLLNDTLLLDPETQYFYDVEFNNQAAGINKRVFTPIKGTFDVDYDATVGTV